MADAVLFTLLFLITAAAAVALVRCALRHWWSERCGRVYELSQDRLGTTLRVAAAGAAVLAAVALGVPLLSRDGDGGGNGATVPAVAAELRPSAPPRAPARAPAPPASWSAAPRTISRPSGGVLQELADGTRVWTPAQYSYPRSAKVSFPVVVAQVGAGDQQIYAGFAAQVQRGQADPFLVVLPRDCAAAGPDLRAVAHHYRTLTSRSGRAILGVGDRAACAVREAFAHPDRYRAVAGVSGMYEDVGVPFPTGRRRLALLLASGSGESAARESAQRFRTALRPRTGEVRVISGLSSRRELFARVAGYLTEKVDGPERP
ncbi:hypothetical protein [Streptomyces sp. H39-S7]|uniref:hypothetical protein n=1 Tax=Streptomyces sp. H39-S7 TaxID=3004357 RepID=UPI0022AF5379|nr:hypothetical protein [Streptomyces sp. H39-S7]MCZ4125090.1 hypothetical protein [Streptomyces sp. H39-S7]